MFCLSPSLGPGFVIVGFAHTTGKTYSPGRDDISQERGYNVFEFVQPWRMTSVFPEETYAAGGQLLFIQGQHMRPELRCNFMGGAHSGVALHFVSSSLTLCEAEARSPRSNGVLMLQHESHAAPDGQRATIRHRVMPEISYTGRDAKAFGDSISVSFNAVDEATHVKLSWQARIGCQFGGVWVAASAQNSPGDIGCRIPASKIGRVQLVVSDLHSRWPLPLANDTISAVDVPNSGRLSLLLRASAIVEMITPAAGTPIVRGNARTIDVYGQHLVPEMVSLAGFCAKLTANQHGYRDGGLGEVSLKCLVALSTGEKVESAHAFGIGFNAVMIAGGPGDGPSFEAQYLLQTPPQIIATTSSIAHAGDVLTVVGDHFIETVSPLRCITGSSIHTAHVVSSAVARCLVPWGNLDVPASTLRRSSAGSQLKVGLDSGETVQISTNLLSIPWSPQPFEVGAVVPNIGFSHGGAQVTIFPEKGGIGAFRLTQTSIACRFGTVAPIYASFMSADAITCTSPALRPGMVTVGAPAPRLFENAEEYRVLDGPSLMITAPTTVIPSRGGVVEFFVSSSALGSQMNFGCVLHSSRDAPVPVYAGAGGHSSCSLPMSRPGFGLFDVAVTHFGANQRGGENFKLGAPSGYFPTTVPMPKLDYLASVPSKGVGQVHDNVEIRISSAVPTVFAQRHIHSGEIYPGDPLFVIADAGGFSYGELWCVITAGSSSANSGGVESSRMWATIVSSAVALCEVPILRSHKKGGLLSIGATLSVCASHTCGGTDGGADGSALTQVGAHLAIGVADKVMVGLSPSAGSSAGGTPVRIRHQGPSLGSSRQHPVCRMGSIGPISASTAFFGETVELDCVSPAHFPGVVSVALGKGSGWVDDEAVLSFTFVEEDPVNDVDSSLSWATSVFRDDVDTLAVDGSRCPPSHTYCTDVPSAGDILDVKPSWGTSEGGTEITLRADVLMSRAADVEYGTWKASCGVGTVWPVAGYYSPQGLACITPAHAPGIVDVTSPKMVSGSGQPFAYRNTALLAAPLDAEESAPSSRNKVVHVKSSGPRASVPGGLVDVTVTEMMKESSACVFAPVRASAQWIFIAYAHVISSVVLRCEAPDAGVATLGISALEQLRDDSSVSFDIISFYSSSSAHREAPLCDVVELTPSASSARGGSVVRVSSRCLLGGESSTSILDARVGCRFGSLGPVVASSTGNGGVYDVECVAPAHAPGAVPFALTTNWREVCFEPFRSDDPGQSRRFVFKNDETDNDVLGRQHEADLELQNSPLQPLISNVVPWLVWGGNNVLHITGRELPNDLNAACLVGSSLVAAVPVSSALVLCDPFPNFGGGSVKESSLRVTSAKSSQQQQSPYIHRSDRPGSSSSSSEASAAAAPLTMFFISAAPVVGVDVVDGWEQGGGRVNVELAGWAPTGLMNCHFGTVAVHGREGGGGGAGGPGWHSRAAAATGRGVGEWWSEASATATDVECVTPARRSGSIVPIGVSLAHLSTSASFGETMVTYTYL